MEHLERFWDLVVDVWNTGVLGVDLSKVFIAVAILLGFLLFRRIFTRVVMNWLKRMVRKSKTELDDKLLDAVYDPVSFVPVVMGVFFAVEYLPLSGEIQTIASNIVRSLVVFQLFWFLLRAVNPLSSLLKQLEKVLTDAMVEWLIKAIRVAIILVGAATILQVWGIQVGPIIAGLGLLGVAVALGAQDLFKNLIAGILVITERRFHIGDWIRVDGVVEGVVESIGFRSTMIRRFDKALVMVPNATLSDNPVTNFSAMTYRRISWTIGLEYRTTLDQLRVIRDEIENYVLTSDEFVSPPAVPMFVRIDKFNDSSIDMMLYCFTKTTVWGEWLSIKEQLACAVKDIVEKHGAGFAFPSQSIYVEQYPEAQPTAFVPPAAEV